MSVFTLSSTNFENSSISFCLIDNSSSSASPPEVSFALSFASEISPTVVSDATAGCVDDASAISTSVVATVLAGAEAGPGGVGTEGPDSPEGPAGTVTAEPAAGFVLIRTFLRSTRSFSISFNFRLAGRSFERSSSVARSKASSSTGNLTFLY